ncbi:hypothetical protein AWM79_00065 [Pseudomonas agarici]|uniref:Carrier domain-containing protein n=1 Tax=Pseudomonas agarici TaxID=46677 RepID=A0A120I861_PSEAA|nr:hypothetical protein AWM79_00065 [Pseudomonas agarici]
MDDSGQPAPIGVVGELVIGGELLARGYFGRARLSAERFLPDPFYGSGARLYRTGDLARFNAEGVLEYVGRIDHQVKIRGFRIELGEIEARLLEQEAVREAIVLAVPGSSGLQLSAYVVPTQRSVSQAGPAEQAAVRERMRARLKGSLPDYMVPTHVLFLEGLPLSPNGKLDRKALPLPDASQAQQAFVAPVTALEQQIAAIWQAVLKVERVGLNDNFFELGGDSIISIQVVSRARQAGVRFTPRDLFLHQTVQGLAGVARQGESREHIDQGPVSGASSLLPIQRAFFEAPITAREHWNQAVLLKPQQPVQASSLQQALEALWLHHDGLRSVFRETPSGWKAELPSTRTLPEDLLWSVQGLRADELVPLYDQAQASLNLEQGPLLRGVLATLVDGSQRLLLIIHHLVVDGVSWRILLEDLQSALQQITQGQSVSLPGKTHSFKVWAERLQAYAQGEVLQTELPYWRRQLDEGARELPCERPRGSLQSRYAVVVRSRLDTSLTRRLLQDAPAAYRTQVNDLLLTALARVLERWTGQPDHLIQLEGHGREELFDDLDLSRTVGWFTSQFPLRLVSAPNQAVAIKQIKEQLRAIPKRGIGFGLLRYLASATIQAELAALALPRITFNYLGQFDGSFDAEEGAWFKPTGEPAGAEQNPEASLDNWLSLEGQVYQGEFELRWTFSREMFDEATVQQLADHFALELAALVEHCCQIEQGGVTPSDFPLAALGQAALDELALPARQIEDLYPLSPMQQGMLFHTLHESGKGTYINQLCVDVEGLDVERFRAAWQATLDTHDILRSGFLWQSPLQTPLQIVRRQVPLSFSALDWREEAGLPGMLEAFAERERARGFDLDQPGLLRLSLIRTAARRHHLILTHHHILMDGWSSSQLLGEVLQRYGGQAPSYPAGRFRDYIDWLQRQDAAGTQAFWAEQLRPLQDPTRLGQCIARAPAAVHEHGYGAHHHPLDALATARLGAFARQQKVTLNTLLQAAWLLLLQRYTGRDTVVFGTTVSGRPAELAGIEHQLGLFINTLPLVATPRPQDTVGQWLQALQALNLALRDHEHTPLFEVQRWAGRTGEALFDNILVFENFPISEALEQGAAHGLHFGEVINHDQTSFPLTLGVTLGQTLALHYNFAHEHYDRATIERLNGHLLALLDGLSQDAQRTLGEVALLQADEQQAVVEGWNTTQTLYPLERCVHELIEDQVERTPQAPALVFGETQLTYRQLDERANRLAHELIALGVGPEVLVGIAAERSLEMVIGLLAILKAGGAYVPLDPDYPADRLAYLIDDSAIALLLTQQALLARLPVPSGLRTLCLDDALPQGGSAYRPGLVLDPENLAYVIYTSGSTGKPKGAGNRHRALTNRLCWMQQAYGLDATDSVLQKTPFGFDVSVWEFFWPLMTGARLIVAAPGDHRDPARLVALINARRVTTLHFVPSMLQVFLQHPGVAGCGGLRRIICSGEALSTAAQRQVFEQLPTVGLFNLYGPTEAAIDVTHWTCREEGHDSVPIGQPIANLSTYLLSHDLQPLPTGVVGELYLGGEGLARGYRRRAGLTAERFVASPFGAGQRLYRTGDLARYREDGVIEYAGRIDHQVKIRGLRIELGEIEARLLEQASVREAVVLAVEAAAGLQLVGYVVPSNNDLAVEAQPALREALKSALLEKLPEYMVPVHLLFLDHLPLSPNGKLERRALPAPEVQGRAGFRAPQSELERVLAGIWKDVLQLERIGLDDDFFELGGHSLQLVMMLARVRDALGVELPIKDFYALRVLQALAAHLAAVMAAEAPGDELDLIFGALDELEEDHA